jgi:phosphocarrier protein HPr
MADVGEQKVVDLKILNKHGMHARPAAMFVKLASQFDSDIRIEKDGTAVSGKSIMGLLTMELHHGADFKLLVEGKDADKAVAAMVELVNNKFNEE